MNDVTQFLAEHGYAALFAVVLAEQLGLPVPATPFLIAAGALAGLAQLSFARALAIAIFASLLSDLLWFYLGRLRGTSVLRLLSKLSSSTLSSTLPSKISPLKARSGDTPSNWPRRGSWSFLIAKFVPGLGILASSLAGIFGLARWKFVVLDTAAALLWAGGYMGAGWLFRGQLEQFSAAFERFGIILGVGFAVAVYIGVKHLRRRRETTLPVTSLHAAAH